MMRVSALTAVSIALLAGHAATAGASMWTAPVAVEQPALYALEVGAEADSLLAVAPADSLAAAEWDSSAASVRPSALWTRDQMQAFAAGIRDRLLARGAIIEW